eukprot:1690656-Pleurochrysis_carterae.AAC.2
MPIGAILQVEHVASAEERSPMRFYARSMLLLSVRRRFDTHPGRLAVDAQGDGNRTRPRRLQDQVAKARARHLGGGPT